MNVSLHDLLFFDLDSASRLRRVVDRVDDNLSVFLKDKVYSFLVEEIVIELVCDVWMDAKIRKRPIYFEDKYVKVFRQHIEPTYRMYHLLMVAIRLPDSFAECNEQEAIKMIADTMISYFTETPLPLKIRKSFDKERFIADLRTFFDSYKGIDIGSDQGTK